MFIDESGQDLRASPYEVLAGFVIHDSQMWPLVTKLQALEEEQFGCRYASESRELKATKLLKTKVFRHAARQPSYPSDRRQALARSCLDDGAHAGPEEQAALGQAKLAYCEAALGAAAECGGRLFASIIPRTAPRPAADFLRKDYAFLFERFFFLLEERPAHELGIVVFDELERSQSHVLIDQMKRYFVDTHTGRERQRRIIPEPFFVHSHLTTGIHIADLAAYVISWGVRETGMTEPARPELAPFVTATLALRQDIQVGPRTVWAFNVIADLRPRVERGIRVTSMWWRRGPRER
jgi:hypothetical protein